MSTINSHKKDENITHLYEKMMISSEKTKTNYSKSLPLENTAPRLDSVSKKLLQTIEKSDHVTPIKIKENDNFLSGNEILSAYKNAIEKCRKNKFIFNRQGENKNEKIITNLPEIKGFAEFSNKKNIKNNESEMQHTAKTAISMKNLTQRSVEIQTERIKPKKLQENVQKKKKIETEKKNDDFYENFDSDEEIEELKKLCNEVKELKGVYINFENKQKKEKLRENITKLTEQIESNSKFIQNLHKEINKDNEMIEYKNEIIEKLQKNIEILSVFFQFLLIFTGHN